MSHCNFDIVGLLLDTEVCDIKRPNKAGYTPTMLASLAYVQNEDHRDIIRRLFAAGNINACAEQVGALVKQTKEEINNGTLTQQLQGVPWVLYKNNKIHIGYTC